MRNILIFVLLLFNLNAWSQRINFNWNKIIGTAGPNVGLCIRTDDKGFIYTAGCFSNSINFLGTQLTSTGNMDAYLAKMDTNGELIWVKQFSGTYNDKITSLEIDRDNNIYVCGSYKARIRFDTTLVTNNIDTLYSTNLFIAKFNPRGTLIWAKNTGGVEVRGNKIGPVEFGGNRLIIDGENNLIITGESISLDLFDTLAQVETIKRVWIGDIYTGFRYVTVQNTYNFLAKYNTNGEKIWIKQMGGCPYTVKTDNKNNIIVSGYFQCWNPPCDNDFDGFHLDPIAGNTIFIVKYNPEGKLIWAQTAGGLANNNVGYDLAIDDQDNIYLTGQIFCGEIKFGSNIHFSVPCSNTNAFLTKIDNQGNFKWAKILGNPSQSDDGDNNSGNSIFLFDNNIFVTGYLKGSVDVKGHTISAQDDMILEIIDNNGDIIEAGLYGYSGMGTSGKQIAIDKQGNIFVTGYTFLGANDGNDPVYIYIAKIKNELQTSVPDEINVRHEIDIYPNPIDDKFIIETNTCQTKIIQIMTNNGIILYSEEFEEYSKEFDCSFLGKGIYFAKINIAEQSFVKKLIKK